MILACVYVYALEIFPVATYVLLICHDHRVCAHAGRYV